MSRGMRIPSYDEPQVEQRPINGPDVPTQAPLSAFGGGEIAQEASNQATGLAQDVAKRAQADYQDEYKSAVQLQGLELANQLTAEETRAKNALSQVKGKDAIAARDKTLQEYGKFYEGLTKGITNKDVRMLAQEHFYSRRNTLDAWATPYANGQMEEYDNSELLSSIKNEADSAATDPSPANVAVSVMSQKLAIAEFGQRNGRGDEWIKAKQLEASSSTHLEALKAIVNAHQDITAREFFDRNKSEFVGNDVARAESLIKAGSSLAEAMRVRDTIFSVTHEEVKGKDGNVSIKTTQPPITEAEVRDRLNELTKGMDPETRLEAERLSFTQWNQEKQIQAADQAQKFEEAAKILDSTRDPTQVPRDMYLGLSAAQRKWMDERAMILSKPPRIEDDPIAYNNWKSIPDDIKVNMSKEDFKLMVDNGKFTVKTLEKFSDEVETLRRSEDRHAFKWSHDDTTRVFQAAQQAGILNLNGSDRLGTLKGDKNIEVMKFLKNAEGAFYDAANGKPMKPEDKDKVIDQLLKDAGISADIKPKWYGDITIPLWAGIPMGAPLLGGRKIGLQVGGDVPREAIPDSDRKRILESFPGSSDTKVRTIYQAIKSGMTQRGLKLMTEDMK